MLGPTLQGRGRGEAEAPSSPLALDGLGMLPGCHGDLKGGAGAKLHNLIYARRGEEADILRALFWKVKCGLLLSRDESLGWRGSGLRMRKTLK